MKQINVRGLLVWGDEHFQRGACLPAPEIDAEEAGDALVSAVLKHPQRAQALSDALAEPRKPQPYRAPVWAGFIEDEDVRDDERMRDPADVSAAREFNREALENR